MDFKLRNNECKELRKNHYLVILKFLSSKAPTQSATLLPFIGVFSIRQLMENGLYKYLLFRLLSKSIMSLAERSLD